MARPAKNTDGAAKPARPAGPKTLYIVFPQGTDPATVEAVRGAQVTFNGRVLLKALAGGAPAPFLTFTIEAEKRNKGDASE